MYRHELIRVMQRLNDCLLQPQTLKPISFSGSQLAMNYCFGHDIWLVRSAAVINALARNADALKEQPSFMDAVVGMVKIHGYDPRVMQLFDACIIGNVESPSPLAFFDLKEAMEPSHSDVLDGNAQRAAVRQKNVRDAVIKINKKWPELNAIADTSAALVRANRYPTLPPLTPLSIPLVA
jgi:hypothetical protein